MLVLLSKVMDELTGHSMPVESLGRRDELAHPRRLAADRS